MTDGRRELLDMENQGKEGAVETPQHLTPDGLKEAMRASLEESKENERVAQENALIDKRQKEIERRAQMENEEYNSVHEEVKLAINEERQRDPSFSEMMDQNNIRDEISEYIADVCEPGEAVGVVRELANNPEYVQKIGKCKTHFALGVQVKKARKDFLSGKNMGKTPEMMQHSIAPINPNNSPSGIDDGVSVVISDAQAAGMFN